MQIAEFESDQILIGIRLVQMFPIIPPRVSGARSTIPSSSAYRTERNGSGGSNEPNNLWNTNKLNSKDIFRDLIRQDKKSAKKVKISDYGCYSSTFIPRGTKSSVLESVSSPPTPSSECKISVKISETGLLESKDKVPVHLWIRFLRLSNDVHSNNTLLDLNEQQKLILRTTKDINEGDEVQLWFSEDVLAVMNIPFLTPANIRGKNNYTCHSCEKSYEYPNPLKIHLATNCDEDSQSNLWNRLHTSIIMPSNCHLPTAATLYSPPSWPSNQHRLSAFQPVWHQKYGINPETILTSAVVNVYNLPGMENGPRSETAAAHLETMVSNMGTSKQGHLCIYCGKLYSRKYGLKIHIRTHTGFKPLKCKYCFRPFGDPSNLNKHVRLHVQSNTSYKCDECDKILVRRRDLQRHIRSRHRNSAEFTNTGASLSLLRSSSSSSSSDEESIKNE